MHSAAGGRNRSRLFRGVQRRGPLCAARSFLHVHANRVDDHSRQHNGRRCRQDHHPSPYWPLLALFANCPVRHGPEVPAAGLVESFHRDESGRLPAGYSDGDRVAVARSLSVSCLDGYAHPQHDATAMQCRGGGPAP